MCKTGNCNYELPDGECKLPGSIAPFDAGCARPEVVDLGTGVRLILADKNSSGVLVMYKGFEVFRDENMRWTDEIHAAFNAGMSVTEHIVRDLTTKTDSIMAEQARSAPGAARLVEMLNSKRQGRPIDPPFNIHGVKTGRFSSRGVSPLTEALGELDVYFKGRTVTGRLPSEPEIQNIRISGKVEWPDHTVFAPGVLEKAVDDFNEQFLLKPVVNQDHDDALRYAVMSARRYGKSTLHKEMVKAQFGVKEPVFYTSNEWDEEKNLCEECLRDVNHGVADDRDRYYIRSHAKEGVDCEVCQGGAP